MFRHPSQSFSIRSVAFSYPLLDHLDLLATDFLGGVGGLTSSGDFTMLFLLPPQKGAIDE